jgi:putative redox protein
LIEPAGRSNYMQPEARPHLLWSDENHCIFYFYNRTRNQFLVGLLIYFLAALPIGPLPDKLIRLFRMLRSYSVEDPMVQIDIAYQGQLRCNAVHGPSGTTLTTDAPVDNMGRGESFSPTDLVATALGTCMLTIMGIVADRNQLDLGGSTVTVRKEMVTSPIRRIGKLSVEIRVPRSLTEDQQKKLEHAAHACPVHKSLHPDIETPVTFRWGEPA